MKFVREKKYICGNYTEIDIVQYSTEQEKRLPRCKRQKMTSPAQENLNAENSKKWFRMIINANFGANDYHVSCTYADENLPDDETALRDIRNYMRRLKTVYKKHGKELKYVIVTEYGGKRGRIHHHAVINGGVPREEIETAWGNRGFCNVDKLQPEWDIGLTKLSQYLTKQKCGGRHRYSCSRNLAKPIVKINDNAYSARAAMQIANDIATDTQNGFLRLHRRYKKLWFTAARVRDNPVTGSRGIYLMARRI